MRQPTTNSRVQTTAAHARTDGWRELSAADIATAHQLTVDPCIAPSAAPYELLPPQVPASNSVANPTLLGVHQSAGAAERGKQPAILVTPVEMEEPGGDRAVERDAQPGNQPMDPLPGPELRLAEELALALANDQGVVVLVDYEFSQVLVGAPSTYPARNSSYSAVAVLVKDSQKTTAEVLARVMSVVEYSICTRWSRGLLVKTLLDTGWVTKKHRPVGLRFGPPRECRVRFVATSGAFAGATSLEALGAHDLEPQTPQ